MVLAYAPGLTAQTQFPVSITGHVLESSGAVLPDVQITMRNPEGSVAARSTTDSKGQFLIAGVASGTYVLEAKHRLFATSRTEIVLSSSRPVPAIEIVLRVASRKETVNVFQTEGYAAMDVMAGTKTDTPILEAPFSIQVVPQEVLQDQQVTRLAQATRNVSGVYPSVPFFGNPGDQFVIRGFNNNEVVYRDGFRIDSGYIGTETANIEQVEVLKGPASILYGRIEPGGLLDYTTKKPLPFSHYALQQQFGSFDFYRTSFDATGPITKHTLAYRFNGAYEHSASFRQFVGNQRWFLAPVLDWKMSPATQLRLGYQYFNNETTSDNIGLIAYGNRPLASTVSVNNVLQNFPIQRNLGEPTDYYNGAQNVVNAYLSHLFNQRLQLNAMFNMAVTDQSGGGSYADFVTDEDVRLGILNRRLEDSLIGLKSVAHLFTYGFEANLLASFHGLGVNHKLLVGADYYRESDYQTCCDINGLLLDNISIFAPTHGRTIGSVDPSTAFTVYGTPNWYGFYLQDQVQLGHRVFVLGGLRYDLARDRVSSLYGIGTSSDHRITPRVGVVWQAKEWFSLYGSYVENFGASNRDLIDRNNMPLPAETAQQWEFGIKTEVRKRVVGTLACYDLTKTNIAAPDPLFPQDGRHALAIGEARSRGVELDISGAITNKLNLLVAYAYTNARITNDLSFGTAGNRLAGVPKNGGRIWATYSWLAEPRPLTVGGGVTARSAREGDMMNDFLLPGYATFDLMASYGFLLQKSSLDLQINVSNLLSGTYFEASGPFTRSHIAPGGPIAVVSSLRLNF